VTNSLEQSHSEKANSRSVIQEIPRILKNLKVHLHIHNSKQLIPTVRQIKEVHLTVVSDQLCVITALPLGKEPL
jgi:hypothetical protein